MKTGIITRTVCTAITAAALSAGAQQRPVPEQPAPRLKEFKCPVCGSACVNKTEVTRLRRRLIRSNAARNPASNGPQAMRPRQNNPNSQNRRQIPQGNVRPDREQRSLRFDIDNDGQLNEAERTARRAYAQARRQARADGPADHPVPDSPVE